MLAYYETKKILPVWTLYANETNTMTGYHSIPVIVDAYMKGIKGFDAEKAFEAMKATMMQDERGLNFYKKYGYIPYDLLDESVTITLEYAYDDWCVAQMAKSLGKKADAEKSLFLLNLYFLNHPKMRFTNPWVNCLWMPAWYLPLLDSNVFLPLPFDFSFIHNQVAGLLLHPRVH